MSPAADRQAFADPRTTSGNRATLPGPARLAAPAILALFTAGLFFFHLGSYRLWEPDEARYAEIAREMLATRDFLVPHLNYVAYVEKPPLLYWLTALGFAVLGPGAFAARLVPALSAIGGVLATWWFAARAFDRRRALLAGAILATCPLYAVMAQVLTTDMLLSTLIALALYGFYLHWREGGRWRWLFYGAMGFAMLAKGPVGTAIPMLAAVLFLWWQGELAAGLRALRLASGLLVTLLIAAPWFVAMAALVPAFFDFYFVGEHVRRFLESHYSHGEPIYYYFPVVAGGMLPWTLFAFTVRPPRPSNPAWSFCLIAAASILGLFSLASGKLIPYILPALPFAALLIADGVCSFAGPAADTSVTSVRRLGLLAIALGVVGAGAICFAALAPHFPSPYLALARPALTAAGAIVVAGSTLSAVTLMSGRLGAGLAALAGTMALALGAGSYARLAVEPMRSYAALSQAVAAARPAGRLICYHRYVQALPFYTGRRVTLVGPRSELDFGAAHAPDAASYFFDTDADLLRLWSQDRAAVLVIDQDDLDRLGRDLGAVRVIASEHHKRAVIRLEGGFAGN